MSQSKNAGVTGTAALKFVPRLAEQKTDPDLLARTYLQSEAADPKRRLTLRTWRGEHWRFQDGRYARVSSQALTNDLKRFIRAHFDRNAIVNKSGERLIVSKSLVGEVLAAVAAYTEVEEQIDQPAWLGKGEGRLLLAFRNGSVDVERLLRGDVRLQETSPDWFSPFRFAFDFDPKASCPLWCRVLDEVLEGDQDRIRLLQEWFGYCLTPDTTQHKFLVLEGEGANGKSVTLEILTSLVGQENTSNVPLEAFADRFALGSTLGKLLNVCTEVGQIDSVAEATLKSFTAGERRSIDRKHISAVDAYITARLVLATNNRPRFKDGSAGLWRRMLLLPFQVTIPEEREDKHLSEKLREELPGIFLWAVEGKRRLRERKSFTQPAVCGEAAADYRLESNPARGFLTEHYEVAADGQVLSSALYDEYRNWSRLQGLDPLRATDFGKEVRRAFHDVRRERPTLGGKRQWVYEGIRRCPDVPDVPVILIAEAV